MAQVVKQQFVSKGGEWVEVPVGATSSTQSSSALEQRVVALEEKVRALEADK